MDFAGAIAAGEAVRIFTGAPVPPGADSVLIQENATTPDDLTVIALEGLSAGSNIRPVGRDFVEGAVLLDEGTRLGVRQIALAAAMGHGTVSVRRRPQVAILATGDELALPGDKPGPDQIFASNALAVAALVRSCGGEPVDLGIALDRRTAIEDAVERAGATGADVLVTIGGASVGDHDLVRASLGAKGMELDFWKMAMRPGKPLMFGHFPRPRRPSRSTFWGSPAIRFLRSSAPSSFSAR